MCLFLLAMPLASLGLGLGKIKVDSSLNQPLDAEIKLLNLRGTPLSGIKVRLADVDEFERVGMERAYELGLLTFTVKRNKKHQAVIHVTSTQRIDEPFLQFLLDVAWADGQIYRAYTLLLDPPGYIQIKPENKLKKPLVKQNPKKVRPILDRRIETAVVEPGLDDEDSFFIARYGPIRLHEEIWQIASRYKSPSNTVGQTLLAIVGANPSSFKNGNLNGLKKGARLKIPNNKVISRVPSEKASAEIMAHDAAWRDQKAIQHVLKPPYYVGNDSGALDAVQNNMESAVIESSEHDKKLNKVQKSKKNQSLIMTPALKFNPLSILFDSLNNVPESLLEETKLPSNPIKERGRSTEVNKEALLNDELKMSVNVIQALKQSNQLLKAQLKAVKQQNETLMAKVDSQEQALGQLRQQFTVIQHDIKRLLLNPGLAGQSVDEPMESADLGYYVLMAAIIFLVLVTVGLVYFYYRQRSIAALNKNDTVVADGLKEKPLHVEAGQTDESHINCEKDDEPSSEDSEAGDNKMVQAVVSSNIQDEDVMEESEGAPSDSGRGASDLEKLEDDEKLNVLVSREQTIEAEQNVPVVCEEKNLEKEQDEHVLEFNTDGLEELMDAQEGASGVEPAASGEREDNSLDFEPVAVDESNIDDPTNKIQEGTGHTKESGEVVTDEGKAQLPPQNENIDAMVKNLKSPQALETLLALAETYIAMEDWVSAKQSLDEVIEFGTEAQKAKAQALLDRISED